jgi:hypothetical protein
MGNGREMGFRFVPLLVRGRDDLGYADSVPLPVCSLLLLISRLVFDSVLDTMTAHVGQYGLTELANNLFGTLYYNFYALSNTHLVQAGGGQLLKPTYTSILK